MNDHHDKRVAELIAHWAELQLDLVKLLLELPLPTRVAGIGPEMFEDTLKSMANAAKIVHDQPISPRAADMIAQAITFWLGAYDLIRAFDAESTPWREQAAYLALNQTAALSVLAIQEMRDELPG